jgi:hypothetical protein
VKIAWDPSCQKTGDPLELSAGNGHLDAMRRWSACAVAVVAAVAGVAAQPGDPNRALAPLLARISARVEDFYSRARTVTSRETIVYQRLESDFRPVGFARRLVYELRLAWEPEADGSSPTEAKVLRQLLTVNGRPPRPRDEPECTDPQSDSTDALSILLPQKRGEYEFTSGGPARIENRAALTIDFRNVSKEKPEASWTDDCVHVNLPGRSRGRIWVDAETFDVLRLDEHLTGMFDFRAPEKIARRHGAYDMALERYDFSVRYREVKFADPEETLTLPRLVEITSVWRGMGAPRVRVTQEYSDYRRFVTGARIVPPDAVR